MTSTDGRERRTILSVTGGTVSYLGVKALAGVDLAAHAGEIVGVIGPNGAGKSTLVNLIAGVARGGGDVVLNGHNLRGRDPQTRTRAGIVRTFQTPELFGTLTAAQNVDLAARSFLLYRAGRDEPRSGRRARWRRSAGLAREALATVGLEHRAGARAESMSGGEKKLVELARALVQQPVVLILDEPVAGLPVAARQRTIATLRDLIHGSDATCILIEHDMDVIRRACDRIYVLSRGAVIKEGTWEQTSQDEAVRRAYLGSSPHQEADDADTITTTNSVERRAIPK
ncbi:ABC transporter ATP-binding protein [Plantactinospora solaniradicis]|uniref:ABC transporter ATP-binding protein n=1 Tax=Plantactinospora solaniradicis TaxID=1723736 RepID=A0ABW1KE43_9ACTN